MAIQEKNQKKGQQEKYRTNLTAGAILLAIAATFGLIIWRDAGPRIGTEVPAARADHVPDGEPVESPSDPPTSGSHYADPMPAGFYTKESPKYLSDNHDSNLIHSLEHGYVVLWRNFDLLDEQGCQDLHADSRSMMDEYNGLK